MAPPPKSEVNIVECAALKVYPGFDHDMRSTRKGQINASLLTLLGWYED
jgi:hypothetical protein